MVTTLLGRKLGMTQVWSEDDRLLPVTVIQAGPCVISQIKTDKTDGYSAVQIAFGEIKESKVNKPMKGHFDKAGIEPKRYLMEVRIDATEKVKLGSVLDVGMFSPGDSVHVTGVSKGKGFAGVMKRHNFSGGPGGHGSHFHRAPGSIGMCATPARVLRGTRMPGHMGSETVTVRNLQVVRIDSEQNLLIVKGAVPGGKGALLTIRTA
ncbi:MAG: 50S ribosomal protein L3 [Coriobacteriia bacterium]|nr:50S ribosomal protein L3 [Coriobacteriia bacterium]MDO9107901.1 50S ribosomal protein L3 [Coriobacteriia bacterium]